MRHSYDSCARGWHTNTHTQTYITRALKYHAWERCRLKERIPCDTFILCFISRYTKPTVTVDGPMLVRKQTVRGCGQGCWKVPPHPPSSTMKWHVWSVEFWTKQYKNKKQNVANNKGMAGVKHRKPNTTLAGNWECVCVYHGLRKNGFRF